jgi:hypothetical protein
MLSFASSGWVAYLCLVRPMRRAALAFTAAAFLVSSCATQRFEGIPLYGRVHDVSPADLRTAIALVRYKPNTAYRQIYAIDVASSNDIHLYHAPYDGKVGLYNRVERIGGKWRFNERVIGPPSPFRY